jgi:hypothetical protein
MINQLFKRKKTHSNPFELSFRKSRALIYIENCDIMRLFSKSNNVT